MQQKLRDSLQPSAIELSRFALEGNFSFLKQKAGDGVRISSVIKGNAYGHGISSFIPMAESCGINHFSVFSADEAEGVLKFRSDPDTDVMIMGMIRDSELDWAIQNGIEFYLFEMSRLKAAEKFAKKNQKRASVHLQLETGMHRTGFEMREWKELFKQTSESEWIDVKGICTHFAGAESVANYFRIQNQNKRFQEALELASAYFDPLPARHAASSAAFLTMPETHYDMVRVGIAQYGFWPSRETYMHQAKANRFQEDVDPLRRVMTWKSEVMSTKWVAAGDFIGYGNVYMAGRDMQIATVPIGYTHGFGRNLTNAGHVLINGERAQVSGLVNMNMITVDVTDIPGVQKGDEVVLIGHQGDDEITVASFGEMTNNLNYEILTRLPASIPRLVVA
ncbi:alanine racemase [Rhodohalobacter halophilus]|uniref:alanine racemase n=1 Tax=Rhodohalobacter halophilus TaxID=1812810 RepID=UPI00083FA0C0|nr:alanine racemase [Rhodohalobacter halophilus]